VGNFLGGLRAPGGDGPAGAFDHVIVHAQEGGANAVLAMRCKSNENMSCITQVLA
jgi:uncharacterized protein YbjQ (UPF0145 family)